MSTPWMRHRLLPVVAGYGFSEVGDGAVKMSRQGRISISANTYEDAQEYNSHERFFKQLQSCENDLQGGMTARIKASSN